MRSPSPRPDLFDDAGRPLPLGARLHDSGEATVHRHGTDETLLVKLHHRPTDALRAKLEALPGLAPDDPSLDPRHRNFAWPITTVRNASGQAVGTVLPVVPGARSLTALGNPKLRARRAAEMDWHYLHAVAANIAFLFDTLHDQGIIIGDVKPDNILVDDRAMVTLIDCDSAQVEDPSGTLHLCTVGSEGFTAPEWIGRRFDEAPRTRNSDRFGLAVILYQLLTGAHPWTGEWVGGGDPPSRDALIRSGDWPFRPGARLRPVPGMVPPDALSPGLAALFRRAFIAGVKHPDDRPSPGDWHEAICHALAELNTCKARAHHHHDASLTECPWCARIAIGMPDLFPVPTTARDPFAPLILAFERALARGDTRMAVDLWRENPALARNPDLNRLGPKIREFESALSALDRWRSAHQTDPRDIHALAGLIDDLPVLTDPTLFRHENIDGRAIADTVRQAAHDALSIPARPGRTDRTDQDATLVPSLSQASTAPVIDPVAEESSPGRIRYRIEGGWQGLRPARLILTAERACQIPALILYDADSDHILLSVPAQPLRGTLSLTFQQPEGRMTAALRCALPADRNRIKIDAPTRRARTLGRWSDRLPLAAQPAP